MRNSRMRSRRCALDRRLFARGAPRASRWSKARVRPGPTASPTSILISRLHASVARWRSRHWSPDLRRSVTIFSSVEGLVTLVEELSSDMRSRSWSGCRDRTQCSISRRYPPSSGGSWRCACCSHASRPRNLFGLCGSCEQSRRRFSAVDVRLRRGCEGANGSGSRRRAHFSSSSSGAGKAPGEEGSLMIPRLRS